MLKFLQNLFKNRQSLSQDYLPKENVVRDWQLIQKTYAPARKSLEGLAGLPPEIQDKALFGVTSLLWQDKLTGELRKQEILGSDESILEDLFVKVRLYGVQHIKDENNNVYTLSKYIPTVANPLDLPVRQ